MISTTGGSSCCTRKASMIATMENHCQRVRRNLSSRFEGRNKLPKLAFWLEPCGARARMHTTAKNPASRSSSNASLSIFFSKPWESTLLAGKNTTALAGWEQYSPPVLVTAEPCEATARQASTAQCLDLGSLRRGKERTNCATYNLFVDFVV